MEKMGQAIAGFSEQQGGLNATQMENVVKAINRMGSMDKADRQRMEKAVSDIITILKTDPTNTVEFARAVQNLAAVSERSYQKEERKRDHEAFKNMWENFKRHMTTLMDVASVHKYGIGKEFDASARMKEIRDEQGEWMRQLHLTMAQNYGMTGTLLGDENAPKVVGGAGPGYGYREAMAELRGFFEEGTMLSSGKMKGGVLDGMSSYLATGQDVKTIHKVLLQNLQKGVTMQSRWVSLSRQGLQLGRMIGVDAEQTAEELTEWHRQMNFTVDQTAQLSRDLQSVSVVTGVTGNRLLEAAKAARQMADNMRMPAP